MFLITFEVIYVYVLGDLEQKSFPEEFKRKKYMRPLSDKNPRSWNFLRASWQKRHSVRLLSICLETVSKDVANLLEKSKDLLLFLCKAEAKLVDKLVETVDSPDCEGETHSASHSCNSCCSQL